MEQCEISPEENDEISFEGTMLSGCGEPHNRGIYLISLDNSLGTVKFDIPRLKNIKTRDRLKITITKIK